MSTAPRDSSEPAPPDRTLPDAPPRTWVDGAPEPWRPFLRLARYDRPIGFWLLAAPGWLGVALANVDGAWRPAELGLIVALGVGAVAMRGAGCTFNDIIDKDLDAQVERTAGRPLPAGTVSLLHAWMFLIAQALVGVVVLLVLPRLAQGVAVAALPLVAAYPFMKRITWFPQAWLGLTLNWGLLVGYAAAAGRLEPAALVAYLGLAAWTFGYDTIYAHMDLADDEAAGVKSTARYFGRHSRRAIGLAYLIAAALVFAGMIAASLDAGPDGSPAVIAALYASGAAGIVFAFMLAIQVIQVRLGQAASALKWFRFNRDAIVATVLVLAVTPPVLQLLL